MLNIYFGDREDVIYDTSVYFNNVYKDAWITSDLTKRMVEAVDRSKVIDAQTIESPVFGIMSPTKLSGGVKTLILIANDRKHVFNASTCGDNCAPWILQIAEKRKVEINLYHLMDFGRDPFKAKVVNTGKIVHSMAELVMEAGRIQL